MTKIKKSGFIVILLIVSLTIASCQKATPTVDPSLKITEIASTIQAEMTQNAALTPSITPTIAATATATAKPPTPTLSQTQKVPTATVAAPVVQGPTDDNAAWVADITIPDGNFTNPGESFIKTWEIRNTGKTEWQTSYRLVYLDGLQGANGVLVVHLPRTVAPGTTVQVSVPFTAPTTAGTYYSYWRLTNEDREYFGEPVSMKIYIGN